jgi:hypothetical protein
LVGLLVWWFVGAERQIDVWGDTAERCRQVGMKAVLPVAGYESGVDRW